MSWRALVVGISFAALGFGCEKKAAPLAVGSATSLRAAMPKLIDAYESSHPGHEVVATYAASGELKNQVLAGAPLDVLCLAGATPLDDLIKAGRVDPASRQVLASYNLVLVGKRGGPHLTFDTLLSALPPGERLAVGDPRTVPAGEYARDYLRARACGTRFSHGSSWGPTSLRFSRTQVAAKRSPPSCTTPSFTVWTTSWRSTAHGARMLPTLKSSPAR